MIKQQQKIKVMDIEVRADQYEKEQEIIKLINLEEHHGVFEFTFKTEKDLFAKQREQYEFNYKCIRVDVLYKDGYKVDFPIKTEEDYHNFLLDDKWQSRIEKFNVYSTDHFHDGYKYLEY